MTLKFVSVSILTQSPHEKLCLALKFPFTWYSSGLLALSIPLVATAFASVTHSRTHTPTSSQSQVVASKGEGRQNTACVDRKRGSRIRSILKNGWLCSDTDLERRVVFMKRGNSDKKNTRTGNGISNNSVVKKWQIRFHSKFAEQALLTIQSTSNQLRKKLTQFRLKNMFCEKTFNFRAKSKKMILQNYCSSFLRYRVNVISYKCSTLVVKHKKNNS